jgi:hypothetical protein
MTRALAWSSPTYAAVVATVVGTSVWLLLRIWRRARVDLPRAMPRLPLLGNAVVYAKGPTQYLSKTARELGPVFELDLAGVQTVAICSPEIARQVQFASESVLSSRKAIESFGFLEGKGVFSTHCGAIANKYVVKNFLYPLLQQQKTVSERPLGCLCDRHALFPSQTVTSRGSLSGSAALAHSCIHTRTHTHTQNTTKHNPSL